MVRPQNWNLAPWEGCPLEKILKQRRYQIKIKRLLPCTPFFLHISFFFKIIFYRKVLLPRALSIYVASPITSPANSATLVRQPATLIYVSQIASRRRATVAMLAIAVLPVKWNDRNEESSMSEIIFLKDIHATVLL